MATAASNLIDITDMADSELDALLGVETMIDDNGDETDEPAMAWEDF